MDEVQRGLSLEPRPSRLDAIFGPGTFLASRPWEGASRWLTTGGDHAHAMTGRHTAFTGTMPDICHVATRSPAGLAMMRDAGLSPSEAAVTYKTNEQYIDRVRSLTREGLRAVSVYRVPGDVVPPEAAFIPSALIGYLNDKANIADLAPNEGVPGREVMSGAAFAKRNWTLPIVVKVATEEANGGGRDVVPCIRPRHLRRAIERFANAERVVVETFLHVIRNDSVQVAVLPDGTILDFPPTLQIANYRGVHTSSIEDASDPAPAAVRNLALASAAAGAAKGFRGVCGFDVLTDGSGGSFVVDLNFRICASTGLVLLAPELMSVRNRPVIQQVTAYFGGSAYDFARAVAPEIASGALVPIASFDGPMAGQGSSEFTLLLFGRERRETELLMRSLNRRGVNFKGWEAPFWQQAQQRLAHLMRKR